MPNSALTRFLKQGLARGVCPLCRVTHKVDSEFVWHFFDDYSGEAWALDAVRRARGFCAQHAVQLRRLEYEGLKSTLGMSQVYLDALEGVEEQLRALKSSGQLPERAECPACAHRDEEVRKNARYLLETLAEDERARERFLVSPGLCFRHFDLVWDSARSESDRTLLLEVQRRVVSELVADLREHIRKQGHEAKGEPVGREADSWQRAIYLTGGWPASAAAGKESADRAPER